MKKILITILFILGILIIPNSVSAITFDLIAPSGELIRGQEVKFTININTEGRSLSSTSIGMTYETQYLEYVSTLPGNTFTTVSTDVQGGGRLIISGSSTSPYSGSGTYAYVIYKLIATGPGSTELCALFNPSVSPTPTLTPTGRPQPTYTPYPPQPTSPPGQPTYTPYPPQPTAAPPRPGSINQTTKGAILGAIFLVVAAGGMIVFKKL